MPAPVVLVGLIGVFIGAVVAEMKSELENKIGKLAAQAVLNRLEIPLDLDGPVNHQTITAAICAGPLKGEVTFSNFFDRDAVKADVKRIAIERAAQAFGYEGGTGLDDVRQQLIGDILKQLTDEMQAGAGVYLAAAKDLPRLGQIVLLPKTVPDWNKPVDFSAAGIANRAYQAKYRASHTKEWVER